MVENLRKMQELRAQIQAQVKLAETLKKLSDNAGDLKCIFLGSMLPQYMTLSVSRFCQLVLSKKKFRPLRSKVGG